MEQGEKTWGLFIAIIAVAAVVAAFFLLTHEFGTSSNLTTGNASHSNTSQNVSGEASNTTGQPLRGISNGTQGAQTEIAPSGNTSGSPSSYSANGTGIMAGPPSEGSDSANVTIVEFSDFECPFCGNFARDTLPQIRRDYIDTGKVRLLYMYFPLSFHEYAFNASEAAACAADQGEFWGMHDRIYQNQGAMTVSDLEGYASDLGLNVSEFDQCFEGGFEAKTVQGALDNGTQLGVTGTPTFYINGKQLIGALPYEDFKKAIDTALAAS